MYIRSQISAGMLAHAVGADCGAKLLYRIPEKALERDRHSSAEVSIIAARSQLKPNFKCEFINDYVPAPCEYGAL